MGSAGLDRRGNISTIHPVHFTRYTWSASGVVLVSSTYPNGPNCFCRRSEMYSHYHQVARKCASFYLGNVIRQTRPAVIACISRLTVRTKEGVLRRSMAAKTEQQRCNNYTQKGVQNSDTTKPPSCLLKLGIEWETCGGGERLHLGTMFPA